MNVSDLIEGMVSNWSWTFNLEHMSKKKININDSYSNNKDVGFKKSQKSYGTEEINKENPLQHAVIRRYQ